MDKATILAALNATGEINVFRATDNWRKAFDLYKAVKGQHKSLSCGSCYREVKEWLQS